jgi:hypothetical protein
MESVHDTPSREGEVELKEGEGGLRILRRRSWWILRCALVEGPGENRGDLHPGWNVGRATVLVW